MQAQRQRGREKEREEKNIEVEEGSQWEGESSYRFKNTEREWMQVSK